MFSRKNRTIIAEGLKISGVIQTEGELEIHGVVEGEIDCASVTVTKKGIVRGCIKANAVVIDGNVEGPIDCEEIVFSTHAGVIGDVECRSVVIAKGAFMDGRLRRRPEQGNKTQSSGQELQKQNEKIAEGAIRKAEPAVEARHLTGNSDPAQDDARVFLANRGNVQAKPFLTKN